MYAHVHNKIILANLKKKCQFLHVHVFLRKRWLTHLQHYEAVAVGIVLGTDSIVREAESYSILKGKLLCGLLVKVPALLEPVGWDAAEGAADETTKETILLHRTTSTVNDNIQGHGGIAWGGVGKRGREERESTIMRIVGTSTKIIDTYMYFESQVSGGSTCTA